MKKHFGEFLHDDKKATGADIARAAIMNVIMLLMSPLFFMEDLLRDKKIRKWAG